MFDQDQRFEEIAASAPTIAHEEIHYYMDLCDEDGVEPTVADFSRWAAWTALTK